MKILLVGRRVGPRTCCRCGKIWAGELEARKHRQQQRRRKTLKQQTDGKENHQRQTRTPLSLFFLFVVAKGILGRVDPVSILGPGDWSPEATTSELSLHVLFIFVIFRANFCVVTRKNHIP